MPSSLATCATGPTESLDSCDSTPLVDSVAYITEASWARNSRASVGPSDTVSVHRRDSVTVYSLRLVALSLATDTSDTSDTSGTSNICSRISEITASCDVCVLADEKLVLQNGVRTIDMTSFLALTLLEYHQTRPQAFFSHSTWIMRQMSDSLFAGGRGRRLARCFTSERVRSDDVPQHAV